ncbi:hypothetical protein J6590_052731 [Homalodisca vitripennis]|nr:hypothetical protein J6590_052731 [Homalodisca vitripennis]
MRIRLAKQQEGTPLSDVVADSASGGSSTRLSEEIHKRSETEALKTNFTHQHQKHLDFKKAVRCPSSQPIVT